MAQPKILIVDDEPFNVYYLEHELQEWQGSAGSGEERKARFDRAGYYDARYGRFCSVG